MNTRQLVRAGIIAAAYVGLCYALAPFSYGAIQVRLAEAMTLLPILWPEAVIGLGLGAFISNLIGPFGWIDVAFGTLATVIAALITRRYRRSWIAYASPIVVNAIIVGGYLPLMVELPWTMPVFMLAVGAGQAVAVLLFGIPLLHAVKRIGEE